VHQVGFIYKMDLLKIISQVVTSANVTARCNVWGYLTRN